jgi:uncharacterized protein YkwD
VKKKTHHIRPFFSRKNMTHLLQFCCAVIVVTVALMRSAEALNGPQRNLFLEPTNNYRLKHHAPKLKYTGTLENAAQRIANTCKMVHSGGPYGENLAWGYKTATDAVEAWYSEASNYNYDNPGFAFNTGHFTQLVWKDTTEIGCGMRKCKDVYMYACVYKDAGNIVGHNGSYFRDNVFAP